MGEIPETRRAFAIWVLATWAGWVLGVVVVLLLANVQELTGFGLLAFNSAVQ